MGVAIPKYRLYDIDRIISRTLAYAIVTALLAGVYAGPVLLSTLVLGLHTPVAVAVATLAAAALFNPVRRRDQRVVDRRFNRARDNADLTVAAFAARLKDAVDLDAVDDDLAGVVTRTLEPDHVLSGSAAPAEGRLPHVRVAVVGRGHEELLDRAGAHPADQVEHRPALSSVPLALAPPNGCWPTIAPVGLSLM